MLPHFAMTCLQTISFNINGTKDKDFVKDELHNDLDSVCLQEHRLTDISSNILRRSHCHDVFFLLLPKPQEATHPVLACIFKRNPNLVSPVTSYSD